MQRMINMSVGVSEAEDEHRHVFAYLADIAGELTQTHEYVSLTSNKLNEEIEIEEEVLYHDENTLSRVREAIKEALAPYGMGGEGDTSVTDIINELQNAGIFFRERRS